MLRPPLQRLYRGRQPLLLKHTPSGHNEAASVQAISGPMVVFCSLSFRLVHIFFYLPLYVNLFIRVGTGLAVAEQRREVLSLPLPSTGFK